MPIIAAIKSKVKRIFYINSDNNYDAGQLVLSLRIGEKYFGFSVSNITTGELLQLCWLTVDEMSELQFEEIYHTYPEIKKAYSKTVIGFDNPLAIIVPDKLYKSEYSSALLNTMYNEQSGHPVVAEPVVKWQVHTIYTVPELLQQRIKQYFPEAIFHHGYAVGINQLKDLAIEGNLFVDFRSEDFTVLATKGSAVLLFQTFTYSNPADVIYYLLKICQEFIMDPQAVHVDISGLIEQKSALYKELYQYFMNVHFRNANWQLPANAEQEYPSHFFTFFNDLSLCES